MRNRDPQHAPDSGFDATAALYHMPGRTGEPLYTHALSPQQRVDFCSVDL